MSNWLPCLQGVGLTSRRAGCCLLTGRRWVFVTFAFTFLPFDCTYAVPDLSGISAARIHSSRPPQVGRRSRAAVSRTGVLHGLRRWDDRAPEPCMECEVPGPGCAQAVRSAELFHSPEDRAEKALAAESVDRKRYGEGARGSPIIRSRVENRKARANSRPDEARHSLCPGE